MTINYKFKTNSCGHVFEVIIDKVIYFTSKDSSSMMEFKIYVNENHIIRLEDGRKINITNLEVEDRLIVDKIKEECHRIEIDAAIQCNMGDNKN